MTVVFDGRECAREKETKLIEATKRLRKKNIIPKLASIIVGDDPASILYVNLKKKAAERIGCELLVVSCERKSKKDDIIEIIKKYNEGKSVHTHG